MQTISFVRGYLRASWHTPRAVVLAGIVSAFFYALLSFGERGIYKNGCPAATTDPICVAPDPSGLVMSGGAYYFALIGLFALYGIVVWKSAYLVGKARSLAVILPAVFHAVLLFRRPYLSIDVWSYVAHGRVNPYVYEIKDFGGSPFGLELAQFGWRPVHALSPYGALWTQYEILVGHVSDIRLAMLLIKLPIVVASLATAWAIHAILKIVRPRDRLFGTLLYLWNPMIVLEFSAEGHNDAMMIAFVVLGLLWTVKTRPARAAFSMGLGVLTKYLPMFFLPLQLAYSWRTAKVRGLFAMALGLLLVAALSVVLYWPLWAGVHTFDGVRDSASAVVHDELNQSTRAAIIQLITYGGALSVESAREFAIYLGRGVLAVCFCVEMLRAKTATALLQGAARLAIVYIYLASAWFWPWYACLPVALMALSPRQFYGMVLVSSLCSQLAAPVDAMRVNGFVDLPTQVIVFSVIGSAVPLVFYVLSSLAQWPSRERLGDSGESEGIGEGRFVATNRQ